MQATYELGEEEEVFDGDMDFGVRHAGDDSTYTELESGESFPVTRVDHAVKD